MRSLCQQRSWDLTDPTHKKDGTYLIITLLAWFLNPIRHSRHRDSAYIQPSSLSLYVVGFLSDAYLPGKPVLINNFLGVINQNSI